MKIVHLVNAVFCFVMVFVSMSCGDEESETQTGESSRNYNLGFKSAESAREGRAVVAFVERINDAVKNDTATFYYRAGKKGVLLTVYGYASQDDQAKLVEQIRSEHRKRGWRTLYIEFRKREVWNLESNGVRIRGEEIVLNNYVLSAVAPEDPQQ